LNWRSKKTFWFPIVKMLKLHSQFPTRSWSTSFSVMDLPQCTLTHLNR
jgi:hypothetical protein